MLAIFLAIISPLLITDYLGYRASEKQLTELTLSRRESLAHLASIALREKFDRLTDISVSFATRVQFRNLIREDKWDEAVKILKDVPQNFPFIDRLFLANPAGTLMADTPALPGVKGRDFSFRDWYKGVTSTGKPYISEVYKRTAEPQYNVIAVAAPIQGDDQAFLGILVMQVRLDTILEWGKEIEVGPDGFVYFVDRNGHVAGHPKFSPQGNIVDFSGIPVVQKVLKGERGVAILYNPIEQEERLSAYEQVPGYDWGVVVQQPTLTAFAPRRASLQDLLITDGITLIVTLVLAYFILAFINTLNAYRQKERIFLESIGDGLVAIDSHWNITLWNKAASFITGWQEKEVLGKPFRDIVKFIRERDRAENVAFIEEAMMRGEAKAMENDTVVITKDGREIPVGDSAAPIFNRNGEIIGAIIVFRDISIEREAQMLRSNFAYASHQLRTPVNEALWNLEVALEEKDQTKINQDLKTAYLSIKNVHKLVSQLLEVSKLDQGNIVPKTESMKLVDIFEDVLKPLKEKAQERDVEIIVEPISAIAALETDPALLKQVLFEVIENAANYSRPQNKVHITMTAQEKGMLFEVKDAGIGIPEEQQPLIFTKFFRGNNIPRESIGAGLGLYLSREYIKLLGGKIWFTSEEDKGTTFSILVPVA